ncbi:hypothetical protein O971_06545 [Mycobacterium avium subsp. hominissuis 10-4249]|nr:hypothetical protein O971_06545 [Mycobacterium avium subsp. hominissuis 10-4249]KDO98080.1 hypothetical protein MAVA5_06105 [Mycobacterium avium subsp. hominissuis A5]
MSREHMMIEFTVGWRRVTDARSRRRVIDLESAPT